jgi:hypothetical protein
MAITPSGQVKFSDLRTEFIGGSGSVPLGSLYRGGSNIRSKAGNNNATNLAADVPTSGELQLSDYYGTAKGFKYTYNASATDQDADTLFGDDYAVDYPKEVVIPASVTLGTNSTSDYAFEINSGASGSISVTNNGTIIGAGGAGGGGGAANAGGGSTGSAGGDAIKVASAATFVNNGSIYAGGGGGGGAGGGGRGGNLQQQQQTTAQQGPFYSIQFPNYLWVERSAGYPYNAPYNTQAYWAWVGNPSNPYARVLQASGQVTQTTIGQYTYSRGPFYYQTANPNPNPEETPQNSQRIYRIYRTYPQSQQTQVTGHNGGAGGAGGLGRGYNNQPGGDAGSGGSSGSTGQAGNGGAGGTGGTGGGYGSSGSSGASGTAGSPSTTSGQGGGSGGSGGAAGLAVERASPISFTFTNNGTVQGTVQS